MEDVKDYVKITSRTPFMKGLSSMKIYVKNIKNNGLLFGICDESSKEKINQIKFNDFRLVSINSCGYVINKAKMLTFKSKISIGDTIKMTVDRNKGYVRW